MVCVLDTHALLWYLSDSPRLGRRAKTLIEKPETRIVIPTIVMAELKYLHDRGRVPGRNGDTSLIQSARNAPA